MTVRETLLFAARLRLPRSMSLAEKEARVDRILSQLGLAKALCCVVSRRAVSRCVAAMCV